ncbi:zinc finger-containing ubiquitin peptidase 1 [Genypterus blacodes]|uniref:zinc finger-containing ubiquitin peptidase 1 n=1 Tax=Genypterus blacodes TaxID=154954 RepID=UPI003F76DD05
MLSCEICGEELMLEEDMKTHLLLSHLENEMSCPLCSLSGVSYDELSFHISTAHPDNHHSAQNPQCASQAQSTPSSVSSTGKKRNLSDVSSGTANKVISDGTLSVTTEDVVRSKQRGCSSSSATVTTTNRPTGRSSSSSSSSINMERITHGRCDENATSGCKPGHSKVKRKESSSPGKEQQFSCPMCPLVCSNSFILQEHVELHLQEQRSAEESPDSDARLQLEEQQRRRESEAKEEREQFKKLQSQYGLDGSGGYRRQMEKSMERAVAKGLMAPAEFHAKRAEMLESLASGLDDGRTRTQGVVRVLHEYYQRDAKDCVHVWLCADTEHFYSSEGDKGWGCGYRNVQMLLSSLHGIEAFAHLLPEQGVPTIPRIQNMIEAAWKEGLDPQGASHFNQRLQGTRAWIGATEIYTLFISLGISARIIDFHQPTGPGDTHPRLFEWVKQYFSQASGGSRQPPRVIQTAQPPLYLQHQGHSRSIVGVEQRKNGSFCLLLLDPGCSPADSRKLLCRDTIAKAVRQIRKFPRNLTHKQYQVVALQGTLSPQDKQICILKSRTLCAERIP